MACLSNSALFLGLCFKVALLHKNCGLPVARLPSSFETSGLLHFLTLKDAFNTKQRRRFITPKTEKRNPPPRLYQILNCVAGVAL